MGHIKINQSKKPAEGDHIAEDRLTELFNPYLPERDLLVGAEACIADRLLGNELISLLMQANEDVCLVDHWILDRVLVIGEISSNSLIPNGRVVVEEQGDFVAQFLQGHGEDMGNDPDRLTSYPSEDDSFHQIPPSLPLRKGGVVIFPLS